MRRREGPRSAQVPAVNGERRRSRGRGLHRSDAEHDDHQHELMNGCSAPSVDIRDVQRLQEQRPEQRPSPGVKRLQ